MNTKEVFERFQRGPTDIVGIDASSSAMKVVRLRQHGHDLQVVGAALLPPLTAEAGERVPPLDLPAKLRGRHAAIAFTAPSAIVKLLSFPGAFDDHAEAKISDSMGLDDPDRYRVGYRIVTEGHGRGESRVLAVAWPDDEAARGAQLFPSGLPVPHSLEVSGLATMAAFLHALSEKDQESPMGIVDFGEVATTYALFNRGVLALVRRFSFGSHALLDKVQSTLGVDRETAVGIMMDGSFDISQSLAEILEPLIKQLMVSRDFVERRENCRIAKIYASGGLAKSKDAIDDIRAAMDVDMSTWSPFDNLTIAKDALPPELEGQEWRLGAAVGACLGAFEEG